MKINAQWVISATIMYTLCACGGSKQQGGSSSSVGGQAGVGGTTSATGGTTSATGGTTLGEGGTTGRGQCTDGEFTDIDVDAGSSEPVLVTSADGCFWQPAQATAVTSGSADVTVDESNEAQTWQGFGGAFTELGWNYLSQLSQADQDHAIQLLFGAAGARFVFGRIPIGGNDYVLNLHTLDDTGDDVIPDSTEANRPPADLSLSKFSIDRDRQHIIPFIKAAQAANPDIRFWAVPWTPPVWMKTGYTSDNNGGPVTRPSYYDGGSMRADDATLSAYAQYFVKFLQAYAEQGIPIDLVAPQNEPSGGHTYPSCMWDATTYTSFIGKYLGPALSGAGLSTKIMLGGSFDASSDSTFISAVLADATAKSYCPVGGFGYGMVSAANVSTLKAAGLSAWVSEHRAGNYPWLTASYKATAPNDFAYAVETWGLIRDAITKARVTAYNAWHMVLDKVGKNVDTTNEWAQDSLLVADGGQLTVTPAYYVFRHFSHFVEPGAKVIGTTGGDAVAFKNPGGSCIVVLYNSGPAKTMTVAIGDQKLQFTVPGTGFVTLVDP